MDIARLLLMWRVTWPPPREHELWRFRTLGAIVPDLDYVVGSERETCQHLQSLRCRFPTAGAARRGAIVERAGPEMLRMLGDHMMGDNRIRFSDAAENMIARPAD